MVEDPHWGALWQSAREAEERLAAQRRREEEEDEETALAELSWGKTFPQSKERKISFSHTVCAFSMYRAKRRGRRSPVCRRGGQGFVQDPPADNVAHNERRSMIWEVRLIFLK